MRRFATIGLILIFTVSAFSQINQAELLKTLLDLPAPAPFDETDENELGKADDKKPVEYPPDFYSKNKVPPDDAPIEELLEYWSKQNQNVRYGGYTMKPTDVVADRIFTEIEKTPLEAVKYLKILPAKNEYTRFLKDFYDTKSAELESLKKDNVDEYDEEEEPQQSVREAIDVANDRSKTDNTAYYDNYMATYALSQLKEWLTLNSEYFSDELVKNAEKTKDQNGYVQNKENLVALAKYDWEKAEPILERLIKDTTQPASATLAKWAYYAHFLKEENESSAKQYRRLLQDVVADRKAENGVRDLALDALIIEGDFEGRDDWYLSILEDETLFDLGTYTGLQTYMDISSPDKWIPKMIELTGSKLPALRNVAVRNLINFLGNTDAEQEKAILRALLPWLSDPNWARDNQNKRSQLIRTYGRVSIPESIPALISIVQNEKPSPPDYSDGNKEANVSSNVNGGSSTGNTVGLGDSRSAAIDALAFYKDARAIPVLTSVLQEANSNYERRTIVMAIIACGGYNINQQLNFLEAYSRKLSVEAPLNQDEEGEGEEESEEGEDDYYYFYEDSSLTIDEAIGGFLSESQEPDENLVRLVIDRVKTLKKTEPEVAIELNNILQNWKSQVLNVERLNSIANNTADLETILRALTDREVLRKEHQSQIITMRGSNGTAAGIAACLLEQPNDVMSAVGSGDANTRIAALACARLLRIALPLKSVSPLMDDTNPMVSLAAERYLESEDSYEARSLVLSRHAGEAKILGARTAFSTGKKSSFNAVPLGELFGSVNPSSYYYDVSTKDLDKIQNSLREEAKTNPDLQGVYAFLKDDTFGHQILRLYKDKAVYSWYEDEARYRERIVSQEELKLIFDYVAKNQIDDMKPILQGCEHECMSEEFVMFGRNGGRRIYIYSNYFRTQPLFGLRMIFNALEQGESKLNYWLQDKIAGLDIYLDQRNIKAQSLWKNGEDFRVLVLDEKKQKEIQREISKQQETAQSAINFDDFADSSEYYRQYREISEQYAKIRVQRKFEPYQWHTIKDKKLGEKTSQPAEDYSLVENGQFPEFDNLVSPESSWKARTNEFELRVGGYQNDGLFKVSRNGLVSQITKETGYSSNFVVSPDGKWAIVAKSGDNYYLTDIYKMNLQTGKEAKLTLPKAYSASPVAFLPSLNKFLVYSAGYEDFKDFFPYLLETLGEDFDAEAFKKKKSEYFLLDIATGKSTPVTGEFAPLKQITFRNLQKTANADEFWAAIPNEAKKETSIGRYNTKTFKFTEEMKIPQILLDSMEIWVDEKDAKIYFIYEGHLLSLPLKAKVTTPE